MFSAAIVEITGGPLLAVEEINTADPERTGERSLFIRPRGDRRLLVYGFAIEGQKLPGLV
jgi:hypothetical protein